MTRTHANGSATLALAPAAAVDGLADLDLPAARPRRPRPAPDPDDLLGVVGLSSTEGLAYRLALSRPRATLGELQAACELEPDQLARALEALERRGLVSRLAGSELRFVPAPPDLALGTLIRHRQSDLDAVRRQSERLAAEFRRGQRLEAPDELVDIVHGAELVAARFEQAQRTATRTVLQLDTPPYVAGPREQRPRVAFDRLGDGVEYRTLYDRRALEEHGQLEWLSEITTAGERARVIPELPMKLVIVDDQLAILPLSTSGASTDAALLVRPSLLLDALGLLFESFWERGVPVPSPELACERPRAPRQPSAEERRILALVAAGLKDEAIAYRLGLSPRTLRRRVARLMRMLGADTRFQAGYQAARRGWL